MAPHAGAVADRLGESSAVIVGLIVQAIGLGSIALLARPGMAYAEMIAPMIAVGAGFAMAIPIVQKSVVSAVPAQDIGKASGALSMIRQLGGAFGIALTVAMFARAGSRATPQAFSDGFAAAIGVAAILSLAGAIAGIWLPARRGMRLARPQPAPEPTLTQADKA
jgi:MFS family permease